MLDARAAQPDHAAGDRQDQRRRTEVRLHQQDGGDQAGHAQRLEQGRPAVADLVAVAHQVAGEPDDQHHLHRLHHLELRHAQVDPALRAVDGMADARQEHRQQQHQAAQQQPLAVLLDQLQFEPHHGPGQDHAQRQEGDMTG